MRIPTTPSRIESLESRIAPASLITVSFTGGALTLTGDNAAHDFTITALDASTIELHAAAGTLLHKEGVADSDTILLKGALKSVTATLGDAADHLGLVGLKIAGDVTINGGLGANAIDFDTTTIKGGLKINGGADADTIHVAGGALSVTKDFTLLLGDGANGLDTAAPLKVGGKLSYTGGSGADGFTTTGGSVSVGGNLSMTTGAGNVTFGATLPTLFAGVFKIGKKLTIDSSGSLAGETIALTLGSLSTKIGGDLRIIDGAGDLTFGALTSLSIGIGGKFDVTAGAGKSTISLAAYKFQATGVTIDASASSQSTCTIGGLGTFVSTGIHYTGGSGADSLMIQSIGGAGSISTPVLVADLGDGTNTIQAVTVGSAFNLVKLTGGTGNDNFQIASLNGKSSNVIVKTGGGTDTASLVFLNSTAGKISVSNDPTATQATISTAFFNTVIDSLDINLSGTGNQIVLGSSFLTATSGLTVKNTIHVVTGAGADTVDFSGASNAKILGGIKLELGDGANSVTGAAANLTTKSFSVTGGSGADAVALVASGNLGAVTLNLGAGENSASIAGGVAPLALASLNFTSTSAAADTDSLTVARIITAGKLSAKFGAGASSLKVDDSIIGGIFHAETGAGADIVSIDTTATHTGTVLAKAATLLLGDDGDMLTLGGNMTNSRLTTKSTFSADAGAGTNALTNGGGNVFAVTPVFVGF